ncbi:hypothetical protein H6G00_31845 [Leptolyngbya sp. FACHB-541]|uniref:hypothetical protein n=1 Tax=Leptolyngbya sp. FACHB-541 TaxID=2692810 RepID=UPI001685CA27|nr:hypothetical protein [Leptolyngbya sp. FACHB-541]MBD2001135.1 hypothetical protein [Leptolyngbya sp. FACHB-541]
MVIIKQLYQKRGRTLPVVILSAEFAAIEFAVLKKLNLQRTCRNSVVGFVESRAMIENRE